ncbi:MAG: rod-binding protein [Brevinematales bacterium]|nr:rod-binding protein [Brevinematales bacterium]
MYSLVNLSRKVELQSSEVINNKPLDDAKALEREIANSKNQEKLKEVSEEFEAIFVNIMLKEMRKSINETGFLKGFREDIFRDLLYWEYSKLISKNTNLGIAEKIQELYKSNL